VHVVHPQTGPGSRTDASDALSADAATDHRAHVRRSNRTARLLRTEFGGTCLSIAVLLVVVSLSMADGLLFDVVAYERDTTVFYFPLMRWVGQQLHAGTLPLWTPQVFSGYPIFADGEIGLAYPPVLLALWLLSPERAFIVLRLVHIWLAAVGTFWLARVWGLPRSASVLAGLVFALGNFLQAQIHHENIVRTAAWLPVILVLVELALRSTRGSTRDAWTVGGALALGMAGLGLHSQMLAIDLLVLAGYAALRWWAGPLPAAGTLPPESAPAWTSGPNGRSAPSGPDSRDRRPGRFTLKIGPRTRAALQWPRFARLPDGWRHLNAPRWLDLTTAPAWLRRFAAVASVCLPVVVLGMCLAAVQLVPLVELAGFSPRGSGIPYSESAAYSLTPYGLAQLIFPFVFRGPGGLQWGLWTHWESYLYVGLAPLVLAVVGLVHVRRREVTAWGVLAGIGTIVALGQYSLLNLHYVLWLLPGLSGLRAPGRFTIVVVLALAMLAAYGLAWLEQHALALPGRSQRQAHGVARGALVLAVIVTVVVSVAHLSILVFPDQAHALIDAAYLGPARDSYPLTQADVYAGLVWATDLTNPRVVLALVTLFGVAALLTVWLRIGPPTVRRWRGWPLLLMIVAAIDLLAFAWGIHPRTALSRLAAVPPAVTALQQAAGQSPDPWRVLASPVLSQVASDRLAPIGLQDANGYSSLQFVWHRDFLGRVLEVDDDLLDLWNVRYVIDPATFGALPRYKGVDFLPGQMLLHAPAGAGDAEQTFALTPGSDVREIRLVSAMMGSLEVAQDTPVADIELRGPDSEVLARAQLLAGRNVMEWSWDVPTARPYVRHQRVEVAGLDFEGSNGTRERLLSFADLPLDEPVHASSLLIRAVLPHGELAIFGGGVVNSRGDVQQLFGRSKAKYRAIYVDPEMRVFENTNVLPRAFLVFQARTAPSIGASLDEMIHRSFDARQEVVVAADTAPEIASRLPGFGVSAQPGSGVAHVGEYSSNLVRLHTSSDSNALLVVTDTYYPGWHAFVDGVEQPLVRGDLLFRVVPVAAGEHEVELRFEPCSVRLGLAISLAALALAVAVVVLAGRARARGRTT
jgi:Bacterial membrane protein YfhO